MRKDHRFSSLLAFLVGVSFWLAEERKSGDEEEEEGTHLRT